MQDKYSSLKYLNGVWYSDELHHGTEICSLCDSISNPFPQEQAITLAAVGISLKVYVLLMVPYSNIQTPPFKIEQNLIQFEDNTFK